MLRDANHTMEVARLRSGRDEHLNEMISEVEVEAFVATYSSDGKSGEAMRPTDRGM